MTRVALALFRRAATRLRAQAGMTIVETMVAAVILSAGVLGVFVMIEVADALNTTNRGRETATSMARELLEDAHSTTFANIGSNNWFTQTLTDLDGRDSNVFSPAGNSQRTTVTRRGTQYTVTVDACSVDDARDGYGAHSGSAWCSDSSATGTSDAQPEDLKRVAVTIGWTENQTQRQLYQTATFGSTGQVVGPTLSDFTITAPAGLDQNAPVITSNPTPSGTVTFQATSTGAADMKFTVDGVEQTTGVSGGGGTWTYNWPVTSLKDGTYTVSAIAVDALGTRGTPMVKQVKLARGAPTPVTNLTGGYNDVYVSGTKTRVVEIGWDASPEGNVTGYEVSKGATVVCAASLALECMDRSPASSGSTTYTIKTLYTDAAGASGYVTNTYTVTAPAGASLATQYWWSNTTTVSTTKCPAPLAASGSTPGAQRDALTAMPTGTDSQWNYATGGTSLVGCMAPFTGPVSMTAGTNNMTFTGWFKNTATTQCKLSVQGYLNTNNFATVFGSGMGSPQSPQVIIPPNVTVPTQYTINMNAPAASWVAGDQLGLMISGFQQNSAKSGVVCTSTTMYWNSSAHPATITLPITGSGGGGGGTITRPAVPTSLNGVANGDGTTTLTWSPPAGSPPAEFYRIYRDGQNYTERVDTAGDTGLSTISWTDTNTGGTTHVYRVTAASTAMAESDFAGPITK